MPWPKSLSRRELFQLVPVAVPAVAQVAHQQHPPRDAAEYARVLEDPGRDAWQKPHEVVMALALRPTDWVADIGAGTGYFARRFANHAARVYAVDIDPKLIDIIARNAPANLYPVLGAPDDPKLAAGSLDVIFLCDVLHHIANRAAYYPKLRQALKPGGRLINIDFHKRPLPIGPAPEMKLAEEDVAAELLKAGFRATRSHHFLPHQYFIEFQIESR